MAAAPSSELCGSEHVDALCDWISEADMPFLHENFDILKVDIDDINRDKDPSLRLVLDFFDELFFSDRIKVCNTACCFAEMPPGRLGWTQPMEGGFLITINYLHGPTTTRDGRPMTRADSVLSTILYECIHVYTMGMPCDDPDQPCALPLLGMHAAFAPSGQGPHFDRVARALEIAAARLGLPLTLDIV